MKSEIIADSLNPKGKRLTTWILEYPRFVHAEFMTHRMFSKNAASSRAIPIEKMIQQIQENPAMPVWWGKNQSGMQAKEELDDTIKKYSARGYEFGFAAEDEDKALITTRAKAKELWLASRDVAIAQVKQLMELGLHKQIANRLLEPWFNIRIIMSATEMENFFALRAHADAQPEIQQLAYMMLEQYNASQPKFLNKGEWHIPFGDRMDEDRIQDVYSSNSLTFSGPTGITSYIGEYIKLQVAIARCARISYHNFEGKDDYLADVRLCERLFGSTPRHLSPTEHVARAEDSTEFIGNFCGFRQYRYHFQDQNLRDDRVKK